MHSLSYDTLIPDSQPHSGIVSHETLNEYSNRSAQIRALEHDIKLLGEIQSDLNTMMDIQQDNLDIVELKIESANTIVQQTEGIIVVAQSHQKQATIKTVVLGTIGGLVIGSAIGTGTFLLGFTPAAACLLGGFFGVMGGGAGIVFR